MMVLNKKIVVFFLTGFPLVCLAQNDATKTNKTSASSASDCPTWENKSNNNRADYLKYLRNNQGKKVQKNDPYFASANTAEVEKSHTYNKPVSSARTDFYTKKRYALFPEQAPEQTPEKKEQKAEAQENGKSNPSVETELKEVKSEMKEPAPEFNTEVLNDKNEIIPEQALSNEEEPAIVLEKGKGNTHVESTKKHTSPFKNKLRKLFSKKNNKAAKPNYEKCTTHF